MNSNTINNGQQTNTWEHPQRVKIIRWTKARPNRDGNGSNRGVEIQAQNSETRWVSEWSNSEIFRLAQWGHEVWYYGKNQQPSIGLHSPAKQAGIEPQINLSQAQADYYSRVAEKPLYDQIENNINNTRPHGYQPELQPIAESNIDIDEELINRLALVMSNCMNMAEEICPQTYTTEDRRAIAISMAITYHKQKNDIPY
ncbi:hypothetical protein [Myxosarcina sp. GI1]|uniref:hypothetical protein n=1 Tax=Myxosarcina sp. GI1 TaxID=1541065 RepID=UPI00055A1361|nr:hypothetical protein [Myxosarcina sp. GI1]